MWGGGEGESSITLFIYLFTFCNHEFPQESIIDCERCEGKEKEKKKKKF